MRLLRLFCPDQYVESIYDISSDSLVCRGVRGVIVDLDNTLVPWKCAEIDERLVKWIQSLKQAGLDICIVSNNFSERVDMFAQRLGIRGIANASKPLSRSFIQAMVLMETDRATTAVVGDQLLTDILGGNRVGMYSILVKPWTRREFIGTRLFLRQIEALVLRLLKAQDMFPGIKLPCEDEGQAGADSVDRT